ncbi:MAG: hypothetical protein F6K40_32090 [Okeania sp. SIO3I5]|uniref:hypothetical protein n=1 Tax=Okeania sp. SIO3I5 TaxID=2607805 RepID=UPI0013BD1641|nr:hypothetical protein [Okeania sp. SIO3I5]NEQ40621.1 hypothetical protein [Okeania sp. SIO3I5]
MKEFFTRQNIIFNFLEGKEKADTLLDGLDEQGINPDEYINSVEESINFIVTNNIKVTDAGLFMASPVLELENRWV